MECKRCGIDLTEKEYKNVASWFFCLDCFQALMAKAEEKKDEPAMMPAPKMSGEEQRCVLCEEKIEEGTGCKMLGMMLCRECYENLVKKPDIPPRPEAGEDEQAVDASEKPAVMQVRVDFSSPVQCYGCGRQIPAVGSKQFDDQPYCPDCYYRLPEIIAQKPKPFQKPVDAPPSDKVRENRSDNQGCEDGHICQACQRRVLPDNLETVEGFEICRACLTTDQETALEIARIRHRKTLEKIRKELA